MRAQLAGGVAEMRARSCPGPAGWRRSGARCRADGVVGGHGQDGDFRANRGDGVGDQLSAAATLGEQHDGRQLAAQRRPSARPGRAARAPAGCRRGRRWCSRCAGWPGDRARSGPRRGEEAGHRDEHGHRDDQHRRAHAGGRDPAQPADGGTGRESLPAGLRAGQLQLGANGSDLVGKLGEVVRDDDDAPLLGQVGEIVRGTAVVRPPAVVVAQTAHDSPSPHSDQHASIGDPIPASLTAGRTASSARFPT